MALTYGFYNSLNGDRKYDAIQMSSIFDGIINDGVYAAIGDAFVVTATGNDMQIVVGSGRAWFNHTWTLNDSKMPLTVTQSEVLLNRIDTVVIDIDASEEVRANSIKIVLGTPSSQPIPPILANDFSHHQYPLADIYVGRNVISINQGNITNRVGLNNTPFVTGPLKVLSAQELIGQWEREFDDWFQHYKDTIGEDTAANLLNLIDANAATMQTHINNNVIHITSSERIKWNNNSVTPYDAILLPTSWTGNLAPFSIDVPIPGMTSTKLYSAGLRSSSEVTSEIYKAASYAMIRPYSQNTNYITLHAEGDKPIISIPITVMVWG